MKHDYIDLQEKLFIKGKEFYNKDKGKGTLLTNVLTTINHLDKDAGKRLLETLNRNDISLGIKSNFLQRIIINRVLLTHVLKIRSNSDDNLTAFLVLLSYSSNINEWEKVIIEHVIPTMVKNNFL